MTEKLRGVSVGAGYFSRFQHEAWSRIPEVEMVAVCDLVEDKARAIQEQFGIANRYVNWTEMLDREKPDFFDIITPPATHEEMCAFASRHGIHVICQKPLAPTMEEATRIVETAHAAGVRLIDMHAFVSQTRKLRAPVLILGIVARNHDGFAFRAEELQQSLGVVLVRGVDERLCGLLRRAEGPLRGGRQ